jgi:hypothetical protein
MPTAVDSELVAKFENVFVGKRFGKWARRKRLLKEWVDWWRAKV